MLYGWERSCIPDKMLQHKTPPKWHSSVASANQCFGGKILNHECGSMHKEDVDKIELNDNIVNDSDDSFHAGSDMDENPFTIDTETFENEQADLVPAQDVKKETDDGMDDYILSLLGGHL